MPRTPSFDKLFQLEDRSVPASLRFAPTSDGGFEHLSLRDDRLPRFPLARK